MSDRLTQLRSLADGVGDLQHGQPGDEDHCTAADVIRWAVEEIQRHRMTEEERKAAKCCSVRLDSVSDRGVIGQYLDRTAPKET